MNLNSLLIVVSIGSCIWSGVFRVGAVISRQDATATAVEQLKKQQENDRAAQVAAAAELRHEQQTAAEKLERAQELWRYELGELKVALAQAGLYRTLAPPLAHERK